MPSSHRAVTWRTAAVLPSTEFALSVFGLRRTVSLLERFTPPIEPPETEVSQRLVRRHTNLVYLFHNRFRFTGKCLSRSLTLWFLLRRQGIETVLRMGVKKDDGAFSAHAWLEYDGKALTSEFEEESGFRPFPDSILSELAK